MEEPRGQPGGSEGSRDCKDRKLILLQSRWEGAGLQSSGVLSPGAGWNHMDLPRNNWSQRSCAAAEREEKYLFPPPYPQCLHSLALEKQPTGVTPL